MTSVSAPQTRRALGSTQRTDLWWGKPLLVFLGLSAFIVYSTWAAFQAEHYSLGAYLSPFYSPLLFGDSPHSWFGPKPGWWPELLPWSPAFLILWAPGGFRLTCYYYRGAYYKAFWADPPACAVGEPRKVYWGEHSLPLILHNLHRYMLYFALSFLVFLSIDVWHAMWFTDPDGGAAGFGIGVGTLVLLINVLLLAGYTLGCHSLRHLIGGFRNQFSNAPLRFKLYSCASCLNRRHQIYAWLSLFWVGFSDVYVRLCSMGIWTDWRIL